MEITLNPQLDHSRLTQFIGSNNDLESIFSAIDDGITVQDAQGRIIFANESAVKAIGLYPKKDLIRKNGKNIIKSFEIMDVNKNPLSINELPGRQALLTRTPVEKILCFRRKNSFEERWSLHKATPFLDSGGNVKFIVNVFKDITHQRQTHDYLGFLSEASKILSSSLDYKQTLISVADLAVPRISDWCSIYILNGDRPETLAVSHIDPKKVKWARKYEKENPTDMSSNQGVAKVLKTGKAEFYPDITEEMLKQAATSEKQLKMLKELGLSSAMIVPLIIGKKTIGAISFIASESNRRYTIADLYMAEQLASRAALAIENSRLYQNAQELATIVESSDDAIIGKSLDGVILSWNSGAERLYGYKAHEVIGKSLSIIIPDQNIDELGEIMEIIKMGQSVDHFETVRKNKDGKIIDVSVSVSPIKDKSGNIIGASAIARDISETKELERRKDAFIGMASHELKTPITTIRAFIQLLQKRLDNNPDPDVKKFLQKTDEQTSKISGLISQLLDLSKIQAGRLELNKTYFGFDTFLKSIVEEMKATNPSCRIILEGETKLEFFGDKDRIGQVLINLINNAVKYSPNKEKVIVKTENNKKSIIVSVRDFGIGISNPHQKRIFDRFYRAAGKSEKTFPGLGIGLYISAEIISRHGGKIWVKSHKGKGSTFFISLPIK